MRINGIMIDCTRIIEQHDYYRRLIDFMAEWGMNTLLWHFTDDTGMSVALPGFETVAEPHAFTAKDMKALVAYAAKKKIDIIPELETFGHTRYLTDRKEYKHLYAGKKTKELTFNAVDPKNKETLAVMKKLIAATAKVFSSDFLHIGCDEVDLKEYCKANSGLDESATWAEYVNTIIGMVKGAKKTPMMWADHPTKDKKIAKLIRKDVILIDWRYHRTVKDDVHAKLAGAGFKKIITAPSIACWEYRFLPNDIALENTQKMASFAFKHNALGLITTIWCPFRYIQSALYYGIAYSAEVYKGKGKINDKKFHARFAETVFGSDLNDTLATVLILYPSLVIDHRAAKGAVDNKPLTGKDDVKALAAVFSNAKELLDIASWYQPKKNADIYEAMLLAAKCAYLVSGYHVLNKSSDGAGKAAFNTLLRETKKLIAAEWDKGRFADDPQKYKPKFPDHEHQFAVVLIDSILPLE
ncbi:MAG: family 20 glycosylhydrolase [Spirochaetes bacterium]|nr:family 20 glycosylhydrolase [Spirochaetota bacterium]